MNTTTLLSYFKSRLIEFQRLTDHSIRILFGTPASHRSMITPQLFVGGQFFERGMKRLRQWGITAVVNMRMHHPPAFKHHSWLKALHLPTIDNTAPSMEHLKKGIEFIQREIDAGGKVYVHCRAGEGRGPTMAVAYLISTGLTFEDAEAQVKKVRTFIRITPPQRKILQELEFDYKIVN